MGREDKPHILVVDDGEDYANIVHEFLPEFELVQPEGDSRLPDGPSALEYLDAVAELPDVILLDMNFDVPEDRLLPLGASPKRTRRFQGVAILREIRQRWPELPVVLMTAVEDLSLVDVDGELSAHSMTYFLENDDLDTLRIRINAALEQKALGLEEDNLLWGSDSALRSIRRRLSVLARSTLPVILEGETGTGKSYLAEQFIHRNSGRKGPFITADLSSIPSDLVPAFLFGATRGAYTGSVENRKGVFELADGGTLFLDEIQNVPLDVQRQLLTVLQERRVRPLGAAKEVEVDVKIVAASNASLDEAVSEGRFRQDLFMRLGPATRVTLPPLRERADDLPFLIRRLVERAATDVDVAPLLEQVRVASGLPAEAPVHWQVGRGEEDAEDAMTLVCPEPTFRRLTEHSWPGNFRELAMVIHNIVVFTAVGALDAVQGGVTLRRGRLQIDPGLVGELLSAVPALGPSTAGGERAIPVKIEAAASLNAVAVEVERQYFRHLFLETSGDFERMAQQLLGDAGKARAVRLRFNQIGLKVRELRRG